MPKKFQGENTKAVEARTREAVKKAEEAAKKKQQQEDEFWKDDDKLIAKKQQRKEERDKKKHELNERKLESKQLLEREVESLTGAKSAPVKKVTQAEIQAQQNRLLMERQKAEEKARAEAKKIVPAEEGIILENVNRLQLEGETARTVDEALMVLGNAEGCEDKHPERRLKAAFTAFEEKYLPQLKVDNPNLRLSQLKQMLKKEWMKSPENPMNQLT